MTQPSGPTVSPPTIMSVPGQPLIQSQQVSVMQTPNYEQLHSFQPTPEVLPMDTNQMPIHESNWELTKRKLLRFQPSTRSTLVTLFGLLLLALVSVVPLMDVVNLAWDPIFVYFVGRQWPICVVLSVVGLAIVYVYCIGFVYNSSPVDTKIEQIVMVIAVVGVTALGLLFLLISLPMIRESQEAYNDLMHSCENPRTINLCAYYNALLQIRMQPDCLSQASIEMCPSFQRSEPYTGFLKQLELKYRCSGFGSGNLTNNTLPASMSPAAGSLIPAAYPALGKNSRAFKLLSSKKFDGPGNHLQRPKSTPAALETPEVLLPSSRKSTKIVSAPQSLHQGTASQRLEMEDASARMPVSNRLGFTVASSTAPRHFEGN